MSPKNHSKQSRARVYRDRLCDWWLTNLYNAWL